MRVRTARQIVVGKQRRVARGYNARLLAPVPVVPFASSTLNFDNLQSQHLNLGALPLLSGAARFVFCFWFRYGVAGWPASRVLISNNQVGARQFLVDTQARGGAGEFRMSVGNGTTLQSIFAPDGTFEGEWWFQALGYFDLAADSAGLFQNGRAVTLQGKTGVFASSLPNVAQAALIGAVGAAAPTSFWLGQMSNVALWAAPSNGWLPTAAQARALWGDNRLLDYRGLTSLGIPLPTYYVPGLAVPASEVMVGGSVTGTTGSSVSVPDPIITEDEMFSHRFEIQNGNEPWLGTGQGGLGYYMATPSIAIDALGMVGSYNRGALHGGGQARGFIFQSFDMARWPIGDRPYPGDPAQSIPFALPVGALSGDATASHRNFTLTRFPGLGVGGVDRWITAFNEDGWSVPQPPDNRMRRIWVAICDGDPRISGNWQAPVQFIGSGTRWNSVGRARPVLCPDGSIVFGYYYQHNNESRYTSAVARSTDRGLTFQPFSDIVQDPNPNGVQFEEPHLMNLQGRLVAFVRTDNAPLERRILRSSSPDWGASWPPVQNVTGGWQNPVFVYRPRDQLLVALQRHSASPDIDQSWPVVKGSRDLGVRWSPDRRVPSIYDFRSAQGDLIRLPDDRLAMIWAQDIQLTNRTRLWYGIFRESFLDSLR